MPTEISVSSEQLADVLDEDDPEQFDGAIEIEMAEAIVNDELAPYSTKTSRLELTGALIAAAYVHDDGDGGLSSVRHGQSQVSWDNDNAISFWERAVHVDPTDRLGSLDEKSVSFASAGGGGRHRSRSRRRR